MLGESYNKKILPAVAVDRALAILSLLSKAKQPQALATLSCALNIEENSIYGILQPLVAAGAVEDTGRRGYRLGSFVDELANNKRGNRKLADLVLPYLNEIATRTGQSSMFGVPIGDRFHILTVVEGTGPYHVRASKGSSISLKEGVVGKIAFAWELVSVRENSGGFGKDAAGEAGNFIEEMKTIRSRRLAMDPGEHMTALYSAAAPILETDRLIGIILSTGFRDQLGEDGVLSLGQAVADAAMKVSKEID